MLGIVARDGAFATHLRLPIRNLHAVPDAMPDEVAAFTEPTAAALELQQQVRVSPGDRAVEVGAGKLGNLVAQTLAATGCRLLVVGRSPRPLAILAARGIPTATAEGIEPRRADLAVECTGNPEGLELARRAVRPRGTIVLKSTYHGKAVIDMAPLVVDEITRGAGPSPRPSRASPGATWTPGRSSRPATRWRTRWPRSPTPRGRER